MTITNLIATTQKSYYEKAKVIVDDYFITLRSYDTNVIAIEKSTNKLVRLWNGWSKTTANHINDFLKLYGFNTMSKKEWLNMPCVNNENVYSIYISTGFYTHKSNILLTETEAEKEIERITENNNRIMAWYE